MDKVMALCGTVFFVTFAVITAMVGGEEAAKFALSFMFCAGASQYIAQGHSTVHHYIHVAFVVLAVVSAVGAMITL